MQAKFKCDYVTRHASGQVDVSLVPLTDAPENLALAKMADTLADAEPLTGVMNVSFSKGSELDVFIEDAVYLFDITEAK